jgi:hypothetical protein
VTPLRDLLVRVPAVYAELEHALLPGRSGEPSDSSPDPRHRPAPARLEVTEHRHQLLRGLRWWVDAVGVEGRLRTAPMLGDSPARMCAWLLAHLDVMADEDRAELRANLWDWCWDAMPMVGKVVAPATPMLPREALGRSVSIRVAAEALGVHRRTVQRRTGQTGGEVLLRDAAGPLCPLHDLPPAWCAHCRA